MLFGDFGAEFTFGSSIGVLAIRDVKDDVDAVFRLDLSTTVSGPSFDNCALVVGRERLAVDRDPRKEGQDGVFLLRDVTRFGCAFHRLSPLESAREWTRLRVPRRKRV